MLVIEAVPRQLEFAPGIIHRDGPCDVRVERDEIVRVPLSVN